MTYVVKRIDEQMYGCEEPAPGAEVLVDVTLRGEAGTPLPRCSFGRRGY